MKHSGTPASVFTNKNVRAQIEAQLGRWPDDRWSDDHKFDAETYPVSAPAIVRQRIKGPNKLERDFGAWLRERSPIVHEQAVTLLIANGVRYTPDFVVGLHPFYEGCNKTPAYLRAYETKGFMRDDANVKIKVAASVYPWIEFWLVKRAPKGSVDPWIMQRILP